MANDGTVKIGVEFSKNDIQKGYKTIQDEAKKTANSLKSVNDALKLDPKNTDLLIEKQKLLTKAVAAAEEEVSDLSKAMEQAKESGMEKKDAAMYQVLAQSLEKAKEEAKQSADALADVTRELERNGVSADSVSQSLDNMAQDSRAAESALDGVNNALDDAQRSARELNEELERSKAADIADRDATAYEDLADSLDEASDSVSDYSEKIDSLGESAGNSSGGIDSLFNSVAGGVMVGQLAAGAIGLVIEKSIELIDCIWNMDEATEEYREAMGKLNTAFESAGFSVETAKQAYTEFYKILGDTDTATEASQLLASLARNEEDMAKWTDIAAGVYGTFGDALPIEGLIEAANETAKTGEVTGVLADAINWAGMSEDEFNQSLAQLSNEGDRAQLIMNNLGLAYQDATEAFYENNEALIQTRENQAILNETQAELGESVANLKSQFFDLFGPLLIGAIQSVTGIILGIQIVIDSIGKALDWLGEKVMAVVGFFQELFGASKQASNISVSGDSPSTRTGPAPRRGPSAPMALSDGGEGDSISPYGLSRPRAVSALETSMPTARDRVISDLAAAMPAAQSRVAIATAAMAPSAGYSAPPTASYSGGNGGDRQQQPIILRPHWTMRFEGELAQFAQVFKPVIDAEDARVGQGVQ